MFPIFMIALLVLTGICWYRIAAKAGFNPWLGLLMVVPVVNLGFLVWFAFTDWPVHFDGDEPGEGQ